MFPGARGSGEGGQGSRLAPRGPTGGRTNILAVSSPARSWGSLDEHTGLPPSPRTPGGARGPEETPSSGAREIVHNTTQCQGPLPFPMARARPRCHRGTPRLPEVPSRAREVPSATAGRGRRCRNRSEHPHPLVPLNSAKSATGNAMGAVVAIGDRLGWRPYGQQVRGAREEDSADESRAPEAYPELLRSSRPLPRLAELRADQGPGPGALQQRGEEESAV